MTKVEAAELAKTIVKEEAKLVTKCLRAFEGSRNNSAVRQIARVLKEYAEE